MKNLITYGFKNYWSHVIDEEKSKIISENKTTSNSPVLSDDVEEEESSEELIEEDNNSNQPKNEFGNGITKRNDKHPESSSTKKSEPNLSDNESMSNISSDEDQPIFESEKSEDSESKDIKIHPKTTVKSVDEDDDSTEQTSEEISSVGDSSAVFI
jgi:hypothetical protein